MSTPTTGKVTKADIEQKLRNLQGDVEGKIASQRQKIIGAVAAVGALDDHHHVPARPARRARRRTPSSRSGGSDGQPGPPERSPRCSGSCATRFSPIQRFYAGSSGSTSRA